MSSNAVTNRSARVVGQTVPALGGGVLPLIVLTAVAVVLRTLYLSSKSLTLDEGFSAFLARTNFAEFIHTIWHTELNMSLYYVLLRLWMHLGVGVFWMRLLSVVFGVATVPVIYFLGLRLFNRRTATVAALLVVLHPAHVALSQDARSYSLVVLLVSVSSLLFLRTIENPSRLNWAGYAVVTALALYAHFFAALVILAQAVSLVIAKVERPARRALLKAALVIAVLGAPILVFLLRLPRLELAWVPQLHWQQALDVLYSLTLSKYRAVTYLVLWASAIGAAVSRSSSRASRWPYWFVLSWLFVPFAVTAAASTVRPLLVERFLAICIPASVLLAAAGFDFLLARSRLIAAVVLMLLVLYSARSLRFSYTHPDINDDWRSATAYVLAHAQAKDEVVVLPAYARFTFDYYLDRSGASAPDLQITSDVPAASSSPTSQAFWFLSSDFPATGAGEAQIAEFLKRHQEYCEAPPATFTRVRVWDLRWCKVEHDAGSPGQINPDRSSATKQ